MLPGPLEGVARIRFDRRGRPLAARTVGGRVHHFEYDETHRLTAIIDSGGNRTALRFDELNQLAELIQPFGTRYNFLYEAGLPIEIRRSEGRPIHINYTERGNLAAIFDGKGNSQHFHYDKDERLTAFSNRLGAITQYQYEPDGLLRTVVTPNQAVWRSSYDKASQRFSIFFPDGTFEQYEASAAPARFWRRDRELVHFTYDSKLRLTSVKYPGDLAVQLSYNEFGHLTAAENGSHDIHFEYNHIGYRSAEEVDGRRVQLEFGKDQLLASVENHRRERITFGYTADQRISRIRDWDGKEYVIALDAGGRLIGVDFPNGARLRQSFAPVGTVESQSLTRVGRECLRRDYVYDANDVLIQVIDSDHGLKRHVTDAEDRLTAVSSRHLEREYQYRCSWQSARYRLRTL